MLLYMKHFTSLDLSFQVGNVGEQTKRLSGSVSGVFVLKAEPSILRAACLCSHRSLSREEAQGEFGGFGFGTGKVGRTEMF